MIYEFRYAIVRKPGENFARGITTADLGPASFELMQKQHQIYVETLESLGLEVVVLEALPGYPDAHFVEDTALVTPCTAIITNPGAEARKGEADEIEPVLSKYRKTVRIETPGTVDGGDVLMVGSHFFIGISERTNAEGADQLGHILEENGYTWSTVSVGVGLHLKSSVNYVGDKTLLITEDFSGLPAFKNCNQIILDPEESYAGNSLLVNGVLLMPSGFPKTRKKLETLNQEIIELDVSEARKMDGGLTCMSLRF